MIRLVQVDKTFGHQRALRCASFALHRGEVLGLLGHNGAGKTTALRLMTALLEPTAGRIEVLDADLIASPDGAGIKQRLGYVPDQPFLYPYLTGREMLHFIGRLYRVDTGRTESGIRRYSELLDLAPSLDRLIHTYSRGMKRKLSLAASLLHEPLYWLLDEPTESLDPVAIRVLKDLVLERRQARGGVLISTHQLGLAEAVCDRLVILHQGSVVFDGSLAELRRTVGSEFSSLENVYLRVFGLLGVASRPSP